MSNIGYLHERRGWGIEITVANQLKAEAGVYRMFSNSFSVEEGILFVFKNRSSWRKFYNKRIEFQFL